MKVALIGPELEENLGLRYLHASIERSGHGARIFDFHEPGQIPGITSAVIDHGPDIVGLSMVFTGRARQYLDLARALREAGFTGHVTAGGHFASFHAREILEGFECVDSVVHGDGEEAIVDLLASLDDLSRVRGLTFRSGEGIVDTPARENPDDLDARPWPTRPARLHEYLGIPIANMLSSRGCYGNCNYCSIYAWFRQTRGRRLRQRGVERVAAEMACLYHEKGARIFNFHDDNFFVRDASANLERFTALRRALGGHGVGRIALQVKARPDSVDPDVFSLLGEMGLFRVFLGVESNAAAGLKTLGRRTDRDANHRAIRILRDLGVHTSFNLLVFDPETVLADLRDNIDFMRAYPDMPLNFGRVEVYSGTPLEKTLRIQGRLIGDMFGHSYRISDARAQMAFEMYRRIFLPRNFDERGTNLLAMKVDYFTHLIAHFHPSRTRPSLVRRSRSLIERVNLSSADILSAVCDFVGQGVLPSRKEAMLEAERLASTRHALDETLRPRMDALIDEVHEAAAGRTTRSGLAAAASAGALVLAVTVTACKPKAETEKPIPPPPEKPVVDAKPEPVVLVPVPEPPLPPTGEELQAIEARISENYQEQYNAIADRYGYKDKKVKLDLLLDASGKVADVRVTLPTSIQLKELEKEISEMAGKWVFDAYGREISLTVTLEYVEKKVADKPKPEKIHKLKPPPQKKPPDWHMCEMMMNPMGPED